MTHPIGFCMARKNKRVNLPDEKLIKQSTTKGLQTSALHLHAQNTNNRLLSVQHGITISKSVQHLYSNDYNHPQIIPNQIQKRDQSPL